MKKILNILKKEKFTILIIISVFITYNFIIKTYIIPSSSMTNTMKIGDYFIGKKYAYGIRIPDFYIINKKMFPDINNNGYITIWNTPKRGDIIIFKNPVTQETYIKRNFAIGEDEILFKNDNQLYLHFKEGNLYIKNNYKKDKYIKYNNKLWVKNPYMDNVKTIHYNENNRSTYNHLKTLYENNRSTYNHLKTLYENDKGLKKEKIKYHWKKYLKYNKKEKLFTYKIPKGEYFMIGDNRDNSIDSRYFGTINMEKVLAKAYIILFNLQESGRNFINVEKNK